MTERIVHRQSLIVNHDRNLAGSTSSLTFRPSELSELSDFSDLPKSYNCQFDINSYNRLSKLEGKIPPAEYAQAYLNWHRETLINLETNLGERFNAQLFEFKYPQKDGRLMHPFKDEPFLDHIVEGQQHRLGNNTNLNHNQKRELAEVVSFSAVESYFSDNPQSQEKLINPSPPGGSYGADFIDVFDQIKAENKDFVRIRRFAVSTSPQDHWRIAQNLTNNAHPENVHQSDQHITLKATVIKTQLTDQEILALYLPDKSALSLKDYEKLKTDYRPWADIYIETIINQSSLQEAEKIYENSLKFADYRMGKDIDKTGTISTTSIHHSQDYPRLAVLLAPAHLREVKTGCGIQGAFANTGRDLLSSCIYNLNSTSLSTDEDEYGTLQIHCDECGSTYQRTPGKLEKSCRHCGGTKGIVC